MRNGFLGDVVNGRQPGLHSAHRWIWSADPLGQYSGGGVCSYINPSWCTSVTVREQICLPDIVLLSVSFRPFYQPRKFPQIFLSIVYIHPSANAIAADDI